MFLSGSYIDNIEKLDQMFDKCADIQGIDDSSELVQNKLLKSKRGKIYFITEATGVITITQVILGITSVEPVKKFGEIESIVMSGNAVLVMEQGGRCVACKVKANGYPGLSIGEAKDEQVLRGSNEGFCDSYKTNEVLIRKRLRTSELKMEEFQIGEKSKAGVALLYMEGIARNQVLDEVRKRLLGIKTDGLNDSGIIEQLTDNEIFGPFPKYMTTTRPDRATQYLLAGKFVILTDNSPEALLFPINAASFLKTADDYYEKYTVATFNRILRLIAVFLSVSLPALYVEVVSFNPEILPGNLANVFIQARKNIPYPVLIEVILMEISFELIREAGVRVPGTMGNSLGVVGGLVVGQAVVEASLASPIIVVVTAITAMCSFTVPNVQFAEALRVIKYLMIIAAGFFGIFGYLTGLLLILINLSKADSFGFPYLGPLAAMEMNTKEAKKDFILRAPFKYLKQENINCQGSGKGK